MSTKEKILISSQKYFNKYGFGAPTLQQVAQEVGISRGNLTYYFKDKEVLLEALVLKMWEEYQQGQVQATQFPSWNIIKRAIQVLHNIQKDYSFIFFDRQIFIHPSVQKIIQEIEADSIKTQMSMFSFSIQIGNMKKEPAPGIYHNICKAIWMSAFYWHVSTTYHTERKGQWDDIMWCLLYPHFTKKGIKAFTTRFGKNYIQKIGTPLKEFEKEQIDF